MANFSRPVEIYPGVYANRLDGRDIKSVGSGDVRVCPDMWLEGDYLVLSTGHRLHLAGGTVAWVRA